jgi:hypothetical protein
MDLVRGGIWICSVSKGTHEPNTEGTIGQAASSTA